MAFAWLFIFVMGLLLTKVGWENPDLTQKQRRDGFILGAIIVVFLVAIGLFALLYAANAASYKNTPMESREQLNPDGMTWALLEGKILDTSKFADLQDRFSAYIEYSGSLSSRETKFSQVSLDFRMELEDGTVIRFHDFSPNQVASRWHSEDEFLFVQPGDDIIVLGTTFPTGKQKPEDADFTIGDVEFIHLEDSVKFVDSGLRRWGIIGGVLNLVVAFLCLLSSLYFTGQLVANRGLLKAPVQE